MYVTHHIHRFEPGEIFVSETATHRFWLIERGSGQVLLTTGADLEPTPLKLRRGDCFVVAPDESVRLEWIDPKSESAILLEIAFDYLEEIPLPCSPGSQSLSCSNERHFARKIAPLPRYGLLPSRKTGTLANAALRLAEFAETWIDSEAGSHANNVGVLSKKSAVSAHAPAKLALRDARFQQLIALLLEPIGQATDDSHGRMTDIGRSVEYMRLHYGEELTRDRLASVAGLSPWYYSAAFRREMGCAPMTYLNELRMRRAREKLILGRQSVPEVAHRCGFRDETYFNRRFKASSGATPIAFSRRSRERIADMSYAYVTHLLALDLAPCAAMVDPDRERYRRFYHPSIETHLHRSRVMTPPVWAHNLKLLEQAEPELIVCDDGKETRAYGGELERIAPCLFIPWKSLDWRGQLRSLAAYTRRETQAEVWLERYEEEARLARLELERIVEGGTVLLLRVTGERLAVYGRRNVGAVLHGDLGLSSAYDTDGIEIERIVDLDFVLACDPDRILLVVDRDFSSSGYWARLQRTPQWLELRAARNRNVYRVPEMPWLEYSPLAHLWVVRHLPDMLAERQNAQFSF